VRCRWAKGTSMPEHPPGRTRRRARFERLSCGDWEAH
jgi:hypothetical protein